MINGYVEAVLIGLGVAVALEGAAYALAPDAMQRFLDQIRAMPSDQLRMAGLVALVLGVGIVGMVAR